MACRRFVLIDDKVLRVPCTVKMDEAWGEWVDYAGSPVCGTVLPFQDWLIENKDARLAKVERWPR